MIGSAWPPSVIVPPGSVMLFSRSVRETWNSETPFSIILSWSTVTITRRFTPPVTSTPNTPSTSEMAGRILDSSISCTSTMSRSPTTLIWSTGKVSGLIRATIGEPTPSGNRTPLTLELTTFSASAMSVPKTKLAMTIDRFSVETDRMESIPSIPLMAFSMGAVTSSATASGLAEG